MSEIIRVLVADDHPVVRGGIVALVSDEADLEVLGEAADGAEAVQLAGALSPDVLLLDLEMPELNGAEVAERLRELGSVTRILILTTYESDARILDAIAAGASGYLLKAAPREEILAGIRSVAAGATVLSPSIAAALVTRVQEEARSPVRLSAREREILSLVAQGRSNPEIARELFIGEATVKTHLLHVFSKLGVSDRTRAVTLAYERGLLTP